MTAPVPAPAMTPNLDELERSLGYTFRDRALLNRALTHSSKANESPGPDAGRADSRPDAGRAEFRSGAILAEPGTDAGRADNERLEFLGDAVALGTGSERFAFCRRGSGTKILFKPEEWRTLRDSFVRVLGLNEIQPVLADLSLAYGEI